MFYILFSCGLLQHLVVNRHLLNFYLSGADVPQKHWRKWQGRGERLECSQSAGRKNQMTPATPPCDFCLLWDSVYSCALSLQPTIHSASGTHGRNLYISPSSRRSEEQRENRDHHRQKSPILHWFSRQVLPYVQSRGGGLNHLGTLNFFLFDLFTPKLEMLAFDMFPSSILLPFLRGPPSLGVL